MANYSPVISTTSTSYTDSVTFIDAFVTSVLLSKYCFRYYYDLKMHTCATFDYFECKVSLNNFLSLFECNEHCRGMYVPTYFYVVPKVN